MVLKAPAPAGFFRGRGRGILGPRQPYGDGDASLEDAEDDGMKEDGTAECWMWIFKFFHLLALLFTALSDLQMLFGWKSNSIFEYDVDTFVYVH